MKRILSFFLLLVVCLNAWALTWSDTQFTYTQIGTTNNVKLKVKDGVTYGGANVSVPSSVFYNNKTYYITELDENAFLFQPSLVSFVVPNNITKIGKNAFKNCVDLESVELSKATKLTEIGESAFNGCMRLKSIAIPSSVTTIGNACFQSCKELQTITVSSSNQYFSASDNVLYNKSKSRLLVASRQKTGTFTFPTTVRSIDDYAIQNCKFSKLVINEGLTEIGRLFAYDCPNLNEVDFPSTLTKIGNDAFYLSKNITDLYFASATPPIADNYGVNATEFSNINIGEIALHVPFSTKSSYQNNDAMKGARAYYAYDGEHDSWSQFTYTYEGATLKYDYSTVNKCSFVAQNQTTTVANVTVPLYAQRNGTNTRVYGIRSYAFYNRTTLKSIVAENVFEVGPLCFMGCTSLKSVKMGQLTKIGYQAFQNSGLESFTFQRNTEVGSQAFLSCNRLHYFIMYTSEPPVLTGYSLQGVDRNIKIFVSDNTKYKTAAEWSEFLGYKRIYSNLVLNDPNYFFTYYAASGTASFDGFKSFPDDPDESAYVPSTVTKDGVEYSVSSISSYAFAATPELTQLTCMASLRSIGERAFYNSKIKKVSLLNNVTTVPSYNTECINTANVPNGFCFEVLKSMLSKFQATTGWIGIKQYIKPAVVQFSYNDCTFEYDPYEENATVTSAELVRCNSTSSVLTLTDRQNYVIPKSNNQKFKITSIAADAFEDCSNLQSLKLDLPYLESLGDRAFANMSGLVNFRLIDAGSVTSLPAECFLSDSQLNDIYLPKAMDFGAKCCYGCTSLRMLNWDYVKSIGNQAFYYSGLMRVKINSSITSMASTAFCNMPNLKTLVVEGNTSLNNADFRDCPNLKDIVCLSSTAPTIRNAATLPFAGTLYNLHVRLGQKSAYSNATGWKSMNITEDGDNLQSDNMVYTIPVRINSTTSAESEIIFSLKTGSERGWVRRAEFDVELPTGVTVKTTNGQPVFQNVRNSYVTVSATMSGSLVHCIFDYGSGANTSGNSDLQYLKLTVKGTGSTGDKTLHIRNLTLADSNDHPMEKVADVGSMMYCYPLIWGDTNMDGEFNVADVVTLVAYLNGKKDIRISPRPADILTEGYSDSSLLQMRDKLLGK